MTKQSYHISYLYRPGLKLSAEEACTLNSELALVAKECFEEIPDYQCLKENSDARDTLKDKIITIARRANGSMAGFCSAVLLPVPGVGDVLHLGLTCTHPADRHAGLTHELTSKLIINYLVRGFKFKKIWISNVACVLSSLGNVAMHFENVYPSPHGVYRSNIHQHIARIIDQEHRDKAYIQSEAVFDAARFVFRKSVKGTVFQKDEMDKRYWHRNPELNNFYRSILNFDDGDEALQIGQVGIFTPLKYFWKKKISKKLGNKTPRPMKPALQGN
ncbi:hypothetical protein K1X76_12205 [bacterium]|nr:hypothetical protein [bacterium]